MRPNCTWQDPTPDGRCQNPAEYPEREKTGEAWANLCKKHHEAYEKATDLKSPEWNPAGMLRAWVRAGGGAQKQAARMTSGRA